MGTPLVVAPPVEEPISTSIVDTLAMTSPSPPPPTTTGWYGCGGCGAGPRGTIGLPAGNTSNTTRRCRFSIVRLASCASLYIGTLFAGNLQATYCADDPQDDGYDHRAADADEDYDPHRNAVRLGNIGVRHCSHAYFLPKVTANREDSATSSTRTNYKRGWTPFLIGSGNVMVSIKNADVHALLYSYDRMSRGRFLRPRV